MTRGQIAQLQDLSKCYMNIHRKWDVAVYLEAAEKGLRMEKSIKEYIRYLTHQYRHQIAAVKRNQRKTDISPPIYQLRRHDQ